MHENKFQGDIFVEFNMIVFWGVAMIFFPMSCTLVLDFFFQVGFSSSFRASYQVGEDEWFLFKMARLMKC